MDRLLDATARAERDHFWFRGFRRFVTPLLDQAVAGRSNLRLLDCGCGTGNNLELLRRYGRPASISPSAAWPTPAATANAWLRRRLPRLFPFRTVPSISLRHST
jgi:SAM-dependent methyltransferase